MDVFLELPTPLLGHCARILISVPPSPAQDKNILKGGSSNVAPSLAATQESLKKAQLEDKLEGKLEHRPDRAELERLGILKGNSNVAPGLLAKQEELKKAQLEDRLERGLEGRPDREEVC